MYQVHKRSFSTFLVNDKSGSQTITCAYNSHNLEFELKYCLNILYLKRIGLSPFRFIADRYNIYTLIKKNRNDAMYYKYVIVKIQIHIMRTIALCLKILYTPRFDLFNFMFRKHYPFN